MANGETIFSTGTAPDVLICIGSTISKVSLIAIPMMDGIDVILGWDWLDIMNPLVDWRTNSLVLRNGNKLEVVQGIETPKATSCKITDRGLTFSAYSLLRLLGTSLMQTGVISSPSWVPHLFGNQHIR